MESPLSFLPEQLWHRACLATSLAVLLTVALELSCYNAVQQFRMVSVPSPSLQKNSNQSLYRSAILINLRNNILLGSLTYYTTVRYVCQPPNKLSLWGQIQAAAAIVAIEAVLYYLIHKAFHEVPGWYWMHRYHHQFHIVVLPSAANAVSIAEYSLAYMLPLIVATALVRADEISAVSGSTVVAVANLLVHTPWMEHLCWYKDIPDINASKSTTSTSSSFNNSFWWILVSASDHMTHHRKHQKGNYGAPVFHLDRIVHRCASLGSFRSTGSKTKTNARPE